tara:strand:- start:284 stop:562 length:279 start_codon:yes stop_codon:yes gene_type:complete
MLSTPVCGVEIKKDEVAPFEAPWLLKYADTGITPQEQSGIGTPNKDAKKTDLNDFFPKYFVIESTDKKTDKTPQIKNPNIKNGAISFIIDHR